MKSQTRRTKPLVWCLLAQACLITSFAVAEEWGWKAGASRVVITPAAPVWMAGYASRTKPAEGKIHDLYARALALEGRDGQRVVSVSLDVCGIPRDVHDRIAEAMKDAVAPSHLMINCSHTHSGPAVGHNLRDAYPVDDKEGAKISAYTTQLESLVVQAIREAINDLAPAKLTVGQGEARFAVNRRNNAEGAVPMLRDKGELKGPIDHSVPVLRVTRPDGKLRAVLFAYACHNTTMDFYQWCGDYAGFAQLELEANHPGSVALFVMGCGGDQNPLPRRQLDLAKQYGHDLAQAVDKVLTGEMKPIEPSIDAKLEWVDVKFGQQPTKEELAKLAEGSANYQQRWAKRLLGILESGGSFERSYAVPVQVWRLGDQLWITIGGETVVDYSIALKSRFGENAWVTSYSNDVMAYIPSIRVLREGGYEGGGAMVGYGLPCYRWAEEVEEKLMGAIEKLAGQ